METRKRNQAGLRLVWINRDLSDDPRKYPQSAFGHDSSHGTAPFDMRSISIASVSEHERVPYATLRKWPSVVPHATAKASRSLTGMPVKKVFRSMSDYHHTVILNATPNGEFTKWCPVTHNPVMADSLQNTKPAIRRANLQRFIDLKLGGNKSKFSRRMGYESPSYVNDLLKPTGGKSFGEKTARKIEARIGLLEEQLDLKDSPLFMDAKKSAWLEMEGPLELGDFNDDEIAEVQDLIAAIRRRRKHTEKRGHA